MSKGARQRSRRDRSELIAKRQWRTLAFFRDKLGRDLRHDVDPDQFVADMRRARTEVPGATQEIPRIADERTVSSDGRADPTLRELTRDELRKLASKYEIAGRGSMNKEELITALEEKGR